MYALTGMLSETIPIRKDYPEYNENTINFIKNLLND